MTDQEIIAALGDIGPADKTVVAEYLVSLQQHTNALRNRERAASSMANAEEQVKETGVRHAKAVAALTSTLQATP